MCHRNRIAFSALLLAAINLNMSAFPAPMAWRWFNPQTGEYRAGDGTARNGGEMTFDRPTGWEDAVLVLRRKTPEITVP